MIEAGKSTGFLRCGSSSAADFPPSKSDEPSSARWRAARRKFFRATLAAGMILAFPRPSLADAEKAGAEERPQPGDLLVYAEGDNEGKTVSPTDIPLGGPQLLVWPMDPKTEVVRNASRLNQVLLLRLDPASLDEDTLPHSADGIIAYSAICAHMGCPVTGWVEDNGKQVLKCFCHNSEYDPRQNAKVVFGPAPRHLAALPVKIEGAQLTVASRFIGRVAPQQS
jgi:rieske iron-sulfur protein